MLRGKSPSTQSAYVRPCPLPTACPLQPAVHYLLAPKSLVDGEAPVAVHTEQNDLASMVEPGGSSHIHPPLLGGHNRCHCVPCRRRKQAVSGARCSVGLAGFCHGAQPSLRQSIEFCFSCAHGLINESGDIAQWRACGWLMQTEPCT